MLKKERLLISTRRFGLGLLALFIADTSRAEGGFALGPGRLHASVGFATTYTSNASYSGYATTSTNVGDLILSPGASLKYELKAPRWRGALGTSVDYLHYLGLIDERTRELSYVRVTVDGDATINPGGRVEVQLVETLRRTNTTFDPAVAIGAVSLMNILRVAVPIHPWGHALTLTPRLSWQLEFFEPQGNFSLVQGCGTTQPVCDSKTLRSMSYGNLTVGAVTSWKFLPHTEVLVDINTDIRNYWLGGDHPQSNVLRATAGIAGLLTARLNLNAVAGYAGNFSGKVLHTGIANLELAYTRLPSFRALLGGGRRLNPVATYGTVLDNNAYGRAEYSFSKVANLRADCSFHKLEFQSTADRIDYLVNASLTATWTPLRWLAPSLNYTLGYRSSNLSVNTANVLRHDVTLALVFRY